MSAGRCPICHDPKEMKRHLVCPHCWVKVPERDQRELYWLYDHARGNNAHRAKSRQILRDLYRARPRAERKAKP